MVFHRLVFILLVENFKTLFLFFLLLSVKSFKKRKDGVSVYSA